MRYIIAFDVGTTAVKVVCIDRQTGKLTTSKADCDLFFPQPNFVSRILCSCGTLCAPPAANVWPRRSPIPMRLAAW